ncbi:alanine racemase [Fusobacterium sp.]|uniref:alanine racemase n=1 Tax=Fusobacterium sp. TaxID=68766 RepID=UPI002606C22D|nr:alanine racemase [Fusobacterium sp.]
MRAWVEVNTDNLIYNIKKIQNEMKDRKVIAVVKADSYGMGAVKLSQELLKCGIDFFAVATLDEAIELRENGIKEKILILGGIFDEELELAEKYDIHIALTSIRQLKFIHEHALKIKCHIKIETGMGRVGFNKNEIEEVKKYIKENNIKNIIGVYTHLSVSDEFGENNKFYTEKQIEKFNKFDGIDTIEYRHVLNSGGIVNYKGFDKGNYVRAGIIQYGVCSGKIADGYKPVFTFKSRVLFIKTLAEDSDISYGRTATLKKGTVLATISVGYADGFRREISNKGCVKIHNVDCPVRGKVCMDMFMVEIPNEIKDKISVGDEVILYGEDIDKQSAIMNVSIYELFTGIGKRVKRVYVNNKDK